MTETATSERTAPDYDQQPILEAEGMVKLFGRVVGLRGVDLRLYPGEILAVIGDNGAGKSTLIKCLSGAMVPDRGTLKVAGRQVAFKSTAEARVAGIETVYQTLAVAPALDIASNLYLARELRRPGLAGSVLRMLDTKAMKEHASEHIKSLGPHGCLRQQGGDPRRAHGRARRTRDRAGPPSRPRPPREGTGRHSDQPQHAQRVRDR
jgi:fructose transport system ATP-binding protein